MSAQRATAVQNILEAPVAPTLLGLAAPNVLAVAMMTAVTFADAWFVGFLGTADLASLALVFPFLTLMQMMAGGSVGGGTTSAVARALGADDVTRAESIAWHAVVLAALMSVVYMLVLGFFRGRFTSFSAVPARPLTAPCCFRRWLLAAPPQAGSFGSSRRFIVAWATPPRRGA